MKPVYLFLTVFALVMFFLVLVWTFFAAYSNPDKSILVTVDEYGEADIEFAALLAASALLLAFSVAYLNESLTTYDIKMIENPLERVRVRL